MIKNIILIYVSLDNEGVKFNTSPCEIEEKKSIYVITRKFEYDNSLITKHVNKNELFWITTKIINSTKQISYKTYCYPDQIEETKLKLLEVIKETAFRFKNEIDNLIKHL